MVYQRADIIPIKALEPSGRVKIDYGLKHANRQFSLLINQQANNGVKNS